MKKYIFTALVTVAVLAVSVLVFILSRVDKSAVAEVVAQEKISEIPKVVDNTFSKKGSFINIDSLHGAEGEVTVEKVGENYKLKFSESFKSKQGPDLYVYISSVQKFGNLALGGVDTLKTLNLGKLKSLSGPQEYLISKKDFESHDYAIVIWCKSFSVQFSRALIL